MTRMGRDAATVAHSYVGRAEYHLMCKMFVGTAVFGATPSTSPTAIAAWQRATHKHPERDPEKYPAYVPAFMDTSNTAEHVLFTIRRDAQGHRLAISTDAGPGGTIAVVRLANLSASWGPMIGWTEDINDQRIWTPPAPAPAKPTVHLADLIEAAHKDPHRHDGIHPVQTKIVEKALHAEGLLPVDGINGRFGPGDHRGYARWQRRLGYTGAAADGMPGRASLTVLARKHGFRAL